MNILITSAYIHETHCIVFKSHYTRQISNLDSKQPQIKRSIFQKLFDLSMLKTSNISYLKFLGANGSP
ncbi:CLUMA_CG003354, isoform A [Clunio marinus]|uniref:CLUMA_CG003354, isoform A n=1 Tax=Clunio marinus TaxID=568069 RepID=A0A1J1HPQ2_9DIPT|nr:CLUMA_CG003354, isoform A [Clunio marinus]